MELSSSFSLSILAPFVRCCSVFGSELSINWQRNSQRPGIERSGGPTAPEPGLSFIVSFASVLVFRHLNRSSANTTWDDPNLRGSIRWCTLIHFWRVEAIDFPKWDIICYRVPYGAKCWEKGVVSEVPGCLRRKSDYWCEWDFRKNPLKISLHFTGKTVVVFKCLIVI